MESPPVSFPEAVPGAYSESAKAPIEKPKNKVTNEAEGDDSNAFFLNARPGRRQQRQVGSRVALGFGLMFSGLVAAILSSLLLRQLQEPPRVNLSNAWQQLESQEATWLLPTVDQQEVAAHPRLAMGKWLLADAVNFRQAADMQWRGPLGRELMLVLAEHLTKGRSSSVIGATINLVNTQQLGYPEVDPTPHPFTIKRYLYEDNESVTLEIVDQATNLPYAMRLRTVRPRVHGEDVLPETAEELNQRSLVGTTSSMLQAIGESDLRDAAEERGLAVASAVATIQGVPTVMRGSTVYLVADVELGEVYSGRLSDIFAAGTAASLEAKEHAASRMLLQVLQLQHARFSHNNLKLENFFMRPDGSFLLGNFGTGTPIGERLDRVSAVDPKYAEMELGANAAAAEAEGEEDLAKPVVDEKSDMWGLGVCLYKIFTGGDMPFDLASEDPPASVFSFMKEHRMSGQALRGRLTDLGVPVRWQELITGLLEIDRDDRLDAETVSREFQDLLHLRGV
uniref:Protein kinase domain-containing protein n=1 Tax=Eimeria tenella TaxID=5802 RepID=A5JNY9_EIMTE|nr:unknown [Eimeria tenella]